MSLSGNQGWDSGDCVPQSLSRPVTGCSRAAWHQPARAEHRVSVELVAEPINKGGGWRARVEEPSVPWAGGCLALQRQSGPAPGHLTLPSWADFLDGCQGGERSLRLDPC